MKIVIESARPVLSYKSSPKGFEYYVKHWEVIGYFWDGNCMCTKKAFNEKIDHPFLDITRQRMVRYLDDQLGV